MGRMRRSGIRKGYRSPRRSNRGYTPARGRRSSGYSGGSGGGGGNRSMHYHPFAGGPYGPSGHAEGSEGWNQLNKSYMSGNQLIGIDGANMGIQLPMDKYREEKSNIGM